ncbi:MAG TPA: hypothetical protein VM241_01270 [Candidatus Thermoplasmatota archaeon]|nr:hypothetical protein [Candidatus Thermoplasmatota archaeon]
MRRLRLQLRPGTRIALGVLNLVPVPGVGALVAGWRNPHSRLAARGASQAALVLLGSYPLVVPGAVGLAWAVLDAVRILQADLAPLPPATAAPAP